MLICPSLALPADAAEPAQPTWNCEIAPARALGRPAALVIDPTGLVSLSFVSSSRLTLHADTALISNSTVPTRATWRDRWVMCMAVSALLSRWVTM